MRPTVLHRGEWSLCAMEHSLIGPVHIEDPGAPFHHLALPLGDAPVRLGTWLDGRRDIKRRMRDCVGMIEAGVAGESWWDAPLESACFYFMPEALDIALGREVEPAAHGIRSTAGQSTPEIARLLHALHADAVAGQPHGNLVGDAIFVALAARLVPGSDATPAHARPGAGEWRVRRALEYIHARLTGSLDIASIADAAATSPFHLSRMFRAALGLSIWQYVLRERARCAFALMRDPAPSLADIARDAGFETYAGFIAAMRGEYKLAPAALRRALIGNCH